MPISEGTSNFTPNPRIISPGVFSRENDLSGIAQSVADIGGVVVAPFAKGPGFTPTVCNSVAELQDKFGVPDGNLYGPYTATQYLQEKGFVTVCRVGALTGYHQKYPWVIWAEYGTWLRNADLGFINPASSVISQANFVGTNASDLLLSASISCSLWGSSSLANSLIYFTTSSVVGGGTPSGGINTYFTEGNYSSSMANGTQSLFTSSFYGHSGSNANQDIYFLSQSTVTVTNIINPTTQSIVTSYYFGADYTGSVYFYNQPVTIVLSGSVLYNGTTIAATINGFFDFSGSLPIQTSSIGAYGTTGIIPAATNKTILSAILSSGNFVSPLHKITSFNTIYTSSQYPFNNANGAFIVTPTANVSQSFDLCDNVTIILSGSLSGSFGQYNGGFNGGTGTFNGCTGKWGEGASSYKVLGVLADTMFGEINTKLEAPGYLGSSQTYTQAGTYPVNTITQDFNLALSQSEDGAYGLYNFSLDASDVHYITNVFGNDPRVGNPVNYAQGTKKEAAYLYKIFEDDISVISSDPTHWKVHGDAMPTGSGATAWTGEPLNFTDQWSLNLLEGDSIYGLTNAYTPWIISQKISPWNGGTSHRFPLFQLFTLSDGTDTNTSFKIEISQVKLAGTVAGSDWGTFTLTVREYSDVDRKPRILEQFNGLNLDPTSANFVARRIGDRYNFIRYDGKIIEYGTYDNLSKYIRVSAATNPYPTTAVPYGFQQYAVPVNGAIGHWCNPMAFTKASLYSIFPGKYPSGIDFNGAPSGADAELASLYPTASTGEAHWKDNLQYFAPVPAGASVGSNNIFALDESLTDNSGSSNGVGNGEFLDPSLSGSIPAIYDAANETTYVKMRRFVFGFQGGFDGQSPAIDLNIGADIVPGNTQGLDCTNSTTAGSIAYKQCIGALGNADEFDINLIITPGILYQLHPYVTNLVVEMCETRGDCFYILDLYKDSGNPASGQIDEVVNLAQEFDTNYAGTYYPWIKIKDTNINQIVTVPPSVVMPAVYAANDRVAGEWWAAAGLNRGGITQAVQVTDRTTHAERDTLYEGRVNPIAAFPGQGIVAWGQKTLQVKSSALDRINVRRLLIEIKKFFASTARFVVFEQNTAATRNKFLAVVNPYLESIQQRSGLYAFQVKMDESINTPDLIDRNILYGQIWLKPTKAAEFIILDFNILAAGASFPTA